MAAGALTTLASSPLIQPAVGAPGPLQNYYTTRGNVVVSGTQRRFEFPGQTVQQQQFREFRTVLASSSVVCSPAPPVRSVSSAQESLGGSTSSSSTLRVASAHRSVIQNNADEEKGFAAVPTSASAIAAAAVTSISSAPFGFLTKIGDAEQILPPPSAEFLALCTEQFSLCEKIVGSGSNFTVYTRTASSYASGQLEFFHAASYPDTGSWNVGSSGTEVLVVTDKHENQAGSTGIIESAFVQQEAVEVPELSALVLPLVKDMFLVGLLILEQTEKTPLRAVKPRRLLRPMRPSWPPKDKRGGLAGSDFSDGSKKEQEVKAAEALSNQHHQDLRRFTKDQRTAVAKIARTLALACVMDQRSVLLQQASWQRGVHVDNLVNEVRGPLMAVRTLGKMLLPHLKRGEISRDVVEDILVQGDRMNDVVKQMQKVLYRTNTGSSSPEYHEDVLRNINKPSSALASGEIPAEELRRIPDESCTPSKMDGLSQSSGSADTGQGRSSSFSMRSTLTRDEETLMPPVALAAPPQEEMRISNVSEILYQLVRGGGSLAYHKNQDLQLISNPSDAALMAAIDSASLRGALSNLLEFSIQHTPSGGWITAEAKRAPGGGVLVVIEDNGPDIGRVVQQRLLAPLGSASSSPNKGDRNDGSFEVASRLIAARDVLERSSAVLNVKSPYWVDVPSDAGGTHIEIWLPVYAAADFPVPPDVQEASR